jgi:hypothetical protein
MNFAFIDSNNVNKAIEGSGWKLDWIRFRVYLKEKYNVSKAYLFIGYIPDNSDLYSSLQEAGFNLIFKPTYRRPDGKIKGNVDVELVLQAIKKDEPKLKDETLSRSRRGDTVAILATVSVMSRVRSVTIQFSEERDDKRQFLRAEMRGLLLKAKGL